MKPENTNPEIDPGDGAGISCYFLYRTGPPIFWGRCETNATTYLSEDENDRFRKWNDFHPRATINLYPGTKVAVCDTHYEVVKEAIESFA